MGDPCNRGQMLGAKSSTRVHAAPGGQSSLSLGWDDGSAQKPAPKINKAAVYNEEVTNAPAVRYEATAGDVMGGAPPQQQQQQQAPPPPGAAVSSNKWASNQSQNSGNVLSERPSVRLHAPPGGKSSITF
eukprot:TRINITY_DN5045_c0_g2_i1.p1 TRINITY_DN5045_c0_g2~~TRINITY_DN5045_c0_g2_i1.p1  ORF type:complete len:130 (+),score=47.54 TRINITY_DN5045_c0_g2_i1:66-455(+)